MSDPDLPEPEDTPTAERLRLERPLPPAPFRRELSSRVQRGAGRLHVHRRPDHLWTIATVVAAVGLILLGLAAGGI